MSEHKEQPLSATTFEPAPIAASSVATEQTKAIQRPAMLGLGLAGLLLLFVFFVLPRLVAPDNPTQPGVTTGNNAGTAEGSSFPSTADATPDVGEGRSPFAEAQESALRREAQEILQALLSKQSALEDSALRDGQRRPTAMRSSRPHWGIRLTGSATLSKRSHPIKPE